jgi:hypothetical protein
MRARALICAAASIAALMGQARAVALTADPADIQRLLEDDKRHPNMISGVEVRAKPRTPVEVRARRGCLKARNPADPEVPAAKLVATFPANGAVVRPGYMVLRVTFDLPMACVGLLDRHALTVNPCPAPLREPVISLDRRTFLTVCHLTAGKHYGMWLRNFTNLAGHRSEASELVFETSSEPEVITVQDALLEDPWLQKVVQPAASAPAGATARNR